MLTALQVANRKRGIGGSDAAAVIGLSPWRTPYDVWAEKSGLAAPFEGNEHTRAGELLEPVILQMYANRTGNEVRKPIGEDGAPLTLFHREHDFILCHPDGLVVDSERLVECKNTKSDYEWGPEGTDQIPISHLIQVNHNMLVTGFEVADVAVLIAGWDFRVYEIRASKAIQRHLIEREGAFWRDVMEGRPPAPQTIEDAQRMYAIASINTLVQVDESAAAHHYELMRCRALKAEAEKGEAFHKAALMKFMGAADTLVDGRKVLATWNQTKGRASFDLERFRKDHPEIAASYTVTGAPGRQFLPKEIQ